MSKSLWVSQWLLFSRFTHTNVINPHNNPKYQYSYATLLMKKLGLREGNSLWLIGSEWVGTKTQFLPPVRLSTVNQMLYVWDFS